MSPRKTRVDMAQFERVAHLDELWPGEKVGLTVHGKRVLVANIDGQVVAYENRCPHLGLPLSEGSLDGSRLICGGHQWEYDLGAGLGINPASARLIPVPVLVERDVILVDVDGLK
jgi:toluene monooxygenase system ferredoxin subunit